MHRYSYPAGAPRQLLIDLKHGCEHACTIIPEDDFDTVKLSYIEMVDARTIRGYRISNGWAPEQHVYFYAELSEPVKEYKIYHDRNHQPNAKSVKATNLSLHA